MGEKLTDAPLSIVNVWYISLDKINKAFKDGLAVSEQGTNVELLFISLVAYN